MQCSLSSTALKLIAIAAMLADHIGFLFFPDQLLWRIVGRISFPLFAFFIAEGARRTSNQSRYAGRLILFAALSQIPYALILSAAGVTQTENIFFTLSAGLLALTLLQRLSSRASIPLTLLIIALAEFLHFDYGAYGVLLILASSLFLKNRTAGAITLALLSFLSAFVAALSGILPTQVFAVASIPLIARYNGKRGARLPRAFFYGFYPVHLLALWIIWYATGHV